MMRLGLFALTNLAVLLVLSMALRLTGLDDALASEGVGVSGLLVFAGLFGAGGALVSLLMSKPLAKAAARVQVIAQPKSPTEAWLVETVRAQAARAGIGMPEVGIFDNPAPNAFATGWSRNDALVAVSTGLLRQMTRDEVEAVLAHEVSHIENGDMVTLALIQGVLNTFVLFLSRIIGMIVDRTVFRVENGHGPAFWIVSIIAEMTLGIAALAIVMGFSRWREYRADAGAARLAGRGKMIAALARLGAARPAPMPDELNAFAIHGGRLQALFASHPPIEARIAALRALGPSGGQLE